MAHMRRRTGFWVVIGFLVGIFWIAMFFLLFTVHGQIFGSIFYGAMYLTCPASFVLLIFGLDIFLSLFAAPFLNALI